MNHEYNLKYQSDFLDDIELRINGLNAGQAIPRHRPVLIAIIKDELEFIRKNIFERNMYWANVEKLKSLETAFASLEENEKNKLSIGHSDMSSPKVFAT